MPRALSFLVTMAISTAMAGAESPSASASIEGRVIDAGGAPVRKAALVLRAYGGAPPQTTYDASSDSTGRYLFDAVEPGTYTLSAERAGYLPKMYRASPREGCVLSGEWQAARYC